MLGQRMHELLDEEVRSPRKTADMDLKQPRSTVQAEIPSPMEALAMKLLAFNNPVAHGHGMVGLARPRTNVPTLPRRRIRSPLATDDSGASDAERKKKEAQRLALAAERAALEAEQLELQAAQLKLEAMKKLPPEEQAAAAAPAPAPAPLPAPLPAPAPFPSAPAGDQGTWLNFTFGTPLNPDLMSLNDEQVELAKQQVFDSTEFEITGIEKTVVGTMFRGNLRTDFNTAFESVVNKAEKVNGLQDTRFSLTRDPLASPIIPMEQRQIVFLALPADKVEKQSGFLDTIFALLGLPISIFALIGFGTTGYILAGNEMVQKALAAGDPAITNQAIALCASVLALQFIHEAAHFLAAQANGLRTAFPVFLPSVEIGSFGCITRLLTFPKDRKSLFDFAISGPLLAGGISLALYVVGLLLSADLPLPPISSAADAAEIIRAGSKAATDTVTSPELLKAAAASYVQDPKILDLSPVLPTQLFHQSFFLGQLLDLLVPAAKTAPFIALNPLAVVGFIGFLSNCLQLLPVGRLDGGRVTQAAFGEAVANGLSGFILIYIGFFSIIAGDVPWLFSYALITVLFQRTIDTAVRNELSEVDQGRRTLALIALALVFLTVVPIPFYTGGLPPPTPPNVPPGF